MEVVGEVVIVNDFAHCRELLAHVSKLLKMGAYVFLLPTLLVPKPPSQIHHRHLCPLLKILLQRLPYVLGAHALFDTSKDGVWDGRSYKLLHNPCTLLPVGSSVQAVDCARI